MIAIAHHNLANYLYRAPTADPAEQRAHRLAAALLRYLTGETHELTRILRALATELHHETDDPDPQGLPTTVPEVTRLVDAGDGVRFGELLTDLCPDPNTAEQALTDLLATAATLPDQPERTGDVDRLPTDPGQQP